MGEPVTLAEIYKLYKSFNKLCFDSRLPDSIDTLAVDSTEKFYSKRKGFFFAYYLPKKNKIYFLKDYLIRVKPGFKGIFYYKIWGSLKAVIIHEMTHFDLELRKFQGSHTKLFWSEYYDNLKKANVKPFSDWQDFSTAKRVMAAKSGRQKTRRSR